MAVFASEPGQDFFESGRSNLGCIFQIHFDAPVYNQVAGTILGLQAGNPFCHELSNIPSEGQILGIERLRDITKHVDILCGDLSIVVTIDFNGPVSMRAVFGKGTALWGPADSHVWGFAMQRLSFVIATQSPIVDALTEERIAIGDAVC